MKPAPPVTRILRARCFIVDPPPYPSDASACVGVGFDSTRSASFRCIAPMYRPTQGEGNAGARPAPPLLLDLPAGKCSRSGSVSRILSPPFRPLGRATGGDHSSSPAVTRGVKRPTRGLQPGQPRTPPYLALLRVGFALPVVSPRRRCALTAPFHPCHPRLPRSSAVCFLWHFPWGRPRWPLTSTLPVESGLSSPASRRPRRPPDPLL